MSNSTNWTKLVETALLKSDRQLAVSELMQAAGTTDKRVVANAIGRVREKYGHRLARTSKRVGGEIVTAYRILKMDDSKTRYADCTDGRAFGIDLWRGWCNPVTGVCGVRLGLG